jgi:hypothetical protein
MHAAHEQVEIYRHLVKVDAKAHQPYLAVA